MNRRNFMKKVGGALAGLLALPSKKISGTRVLSKEEIILLQKAAFPMYNYDPNIANIDSNSEWAKQRLAFNGVENWLQNSNAPYVMEWGIGKKYILKEQTRT